MIQSATPPAKPPSIAPRAHRFVRRLSILYAGGVLAVVLFLLLQRLPANFLPVARTLAGEAINGGLAGMVLSALLLALTALLGTLALTQARYRGFMSRFDAGIAARQGQALIMPLGALCVYLTAQLLWPRISSAAAGGANVLAALVFALAFMSLISERAMAAFAPAQLPEAPSLRRLLLLTTVLLVAAACIELGRGSNLEWMRWLTYIVVCLPGLVALELAIRALARMFLPAPAAATATSICESLLASLLTGGPRAPAALLRTHLGLDFARSWALSFLSAALLPAILATLLLCWGLSGLKLIDLGQRGIYERFGAPRCGARTRASCAVALASWPAAFRGIRRHSCRCHWRGPGTGGDGSECRRRGFTARQFESALGEFSPGPSRILGGERQHRTAGLSNG